MTTFSDTARAVLAAVLLAVAIGFGALGAVSSSSGSSTTDNAQRPYVYYRCYVQGYGWMYCTDAAHS